MAEPHRPASDLLPDVGCMRLAIVLVAILGLLAGCTGDGASGQELAASEAIKQAGDHAQEWAEDAELVMTSGIEASDEHPATQRENHSLPPDDQVGDGRAPFWTVMYYSQEANNTRSFSVTPEEVTDLEEAEPPAREPSVLAEWTVDSTDAVAIALDEEAFRGTALRAQASIVHTLGMTEGEPVWTLFAQDQQGNSASVDVHAVDGEIME